MKIGKKICNTSEKSFPEEIAKPQKILTPIDRYEAPKSKSISKEKKLMAILSDLFKDPIHNLKIFSGHDNYVYLVDEHFIVRIPRNEDAKNKNRFEQSLLRSIKPLILSTAIPHYSLWDYERGVGGYEEIRGITLSQAFYNKMASGKKYELACDLAVALKEIHSVPHENMYLGSYAPLGLETLREMELALGPNSFYAKEDAKKLSTALLKAQEVLACRTFSPVLLHRDLHAGNIIVDESTQRLSGIIDFADACVGPRAIDFCALYLINPAFADETAQIYAKYCGINEALFIDECRTWAMVWNAVGVTMSEKRTSASSSRQLIRAGRTLSYFLKQS